MKRNRDKGSKDAFEGSSGETQKSSSPADESSVGGIVPSQDVLVRRERGYCVLRYTAEPLEPVLEGISVKRVCLIERRESSESDSM